MAEATAADPRDALYYSNLAALNFQREGTLNADKRGREEAESGYNYGESQIAKARPIALTANRNTANSQGLLESGVLAQRQGRTLTGFTTQEGRLGETRAKAVARYNEGDKRAQEAYEHGEQKELAGAGERYKTNLIQNPPQPEIGPIVGNALQQRPQSTNSPSLMLAGQRAQPNSRSLRVRAAKKTVG